MIEVDKNEPWCEPGSVIMAEDILFEFLLAFLSINSPKIATCFFEETTYDHLI